MNVLLRKKKGFTFIEVVTAMGVVAILFLVSSSNLFRTKHKADLSSAITVFISDTRQQQIKAMSGLGTEEDEAGYAYGISVNGNSYTLFKGLSYQESDSTNRTVSFDNLLEITSSFPSSEIIFATGSGEIVSFSSDMNAVYIRNTATNEQKTIQFNRLGVPITID